jgi:hypothetical protein
MKGRDRKKFETGLTGWIGEGEASAFISAPAFFSIQ